MNVQNLIKLSCFLGCALLFNTATAQQSLTDFSVLPENISGDTAGNPNVLIILDNSGSMGRWDPVNDEGDGLYNSLPETGVRYRDNVGTWWDGASPYTNSYQVRAAMQAILSNPLYEQRLNVGLMAFGQNRCVYNPNENRVGTGNDSTEVRGRELFYRCFDENNNLIGNPFNSDFNVGTNGLGQLRANIAPLAGTHRNRLLDLLGFEPSPWLEPTSSNSETNIDSDGGGRPFVIFPDGVDRDNPLHGQLHPFLRGNRTIDGSEVPITGIPDIAYSNNTPLSGALESGFRYLFRNDPLVTGNTSLNEDFRNGLISREISLGQEVVERPDGSSLLTDIPVDYLSASECSGPITVILLTDGQPGQIAPTNIRTGIGPTTGQGSETSVSAAVNAARAIRSRGGEVQPGDELEVTVHVIAFRLNNADAANRIAQAGGTGAAVLTNSTEQVEEAFATIFDGVLNQGATRSGLSVITTPSGATGSFVQPSFTPLLESEVNNDQVSWVGDLRNFFIDRFGNFREDTNGNDLLDGNDRGFELRFSEEADQTFVVRFNVNETTGQSSNRVGEPNADGTFNNLIEVTDLNPIFDVTSQLDRLSDTNPNAVRENRNYSTAVSATNNGRHIVTWVDSNNDNIFRGAEFANFVWRDDPNPRFITPASESSFDLPEGESAAELIRFIRGEEQPNARNRTIDGTKRLLGDIIHSTPVQVDAPTPFSSSTTEYNESHEAFREAYADRRRMIYVGANDGMLHAINAGFWDVDTEAGTAVVRRSPNGQTNHELGDEVWAYVPRAAMPYLKFLRDPSYLADRHISFVDGSLQAFDVRIFNNRSDNCVLNPGDSVPGGCRYINGWGTIIVGGMRLGGAEYRADQNGDGDTNDAGDVFRSSYFVFDVTNPELRPRMIGEFSHPDMGFSIPQPTLARIAGSSSDQRNHFLVFGSGPNDLQTSTRIDGEQTSVFTLHLEQTNRGIFKHEVSASDANSFAGDLTSVDWNQDDIDDAVYFGTISGTQQAPSGNVIRAARRFNPNLASGDIFDFAELIDTNRPVQHELVPQTNQATENVKNLFFGTGRTLDITDFQIEYTPLNRLYGVVEQITSSLGETNLTFDSGNPVIRESDLLNVNNMDLGATEQEEEIINGLTRDEVADQFETGVYKGWFLDLPENNSRLSARPATIEEVGFFTDFQPVPVDDADFDQCNINGGGFLTILDVRTGLFVSQDRLQGTGEDGNNSLDRVNARVSSSLLAAGEIFVVGTNEDGSTRGRFKAPGDNQEVTEFEFDLIPPPPQLTTPGRKSWREIQF